MLRCSKYRSDLKLLLCQSSPFIIFLQLCLLTGLTYVTGQGQCGGDPTKITWVTTLGVELALGHREYSVTTPHPGCRSICLSSPNCSSLSYCDIAGTYYCYYGSVDTTQTLQASVLLQSAPTCGYDEISCVEPTTPNLSISTSVTTSDPLGTLATPGVGQARSRMYRRSSTSGVPVTPLMTSPARSAVECGVLCTISACWSFTFSEAQHDTMGANAVATGLSVTLCIILVVVLVVTALLLYRQCKRNREQKRLREERMRRRELEDAFQPVPSVSSSVSQSMTSLYDNTDNTELVPASRRDPYLHVYDNTPNTYISEESVRVSTVSEPGASVGGRRAQRASYTKQTSSHNGYMTSSNAATLSVTQSAYQNGQAGYGSLGSDTLRYSSGLQETRKDAYGFGHRPTQVTSPPSVTSRDMNRIGATYSSHNTEV